MKTQSSVEQAIERFGRIDVLVNNAGFGHGGMFEEIAQEDIDRMFGTNVFGVFNVTRSVLPFMRASRYGRIVNISSIAAVRGVPGGSQYCACKYAVEGFSEALATEVEQFGVKVTIVQPGLFRTNFFKAEAIRYATHSISDYDALLKEVLEKYDAVNGVQPGDPAKLAKLIVDLAHHADPPLRIAAGSDAVEVVEQKLNLLRSEFERWRDLSSSTDFS